MWANFHFLFVAIVGSAKCRLWRLATTTVGANEWLPPHLAQDYCIQHTHTHTHRAYGKCALVWARHASAADGTGGHKMEGGLTTDLRQWKLLLCKTYFTWNIALGSFLPLCRSFWIEPVRKPMKQDRFMCCSMVQFLCSNGSFCGYRFRRTWNQKKIPGNGLVARVQPTIGECNGNGRKWVGNASRQIRENSVSTAIEAAFFVCVKSWLFPLITFSKVIKVDKCKLFGFGQNNGCRTAITVTVI